MKHSLRSLLLAGASLALVGSVNATPPGFVGAPGASQHQGQGQSARKNDFWWPQQVDLSRLRQNAYDADPAGAAFDYAEAFAALDLDEVKADVADVLTTSQDWWPADYGAYTGLFIRLAWHSAGTYRSGDGRGGAAGGQIRFEPLNSWPDNGNLDKARRLLWPVKAKYGNSLSWADLMILAGNVALETSGFETYGFAGGRVDAWEPELVYWGPETKFLTAEGRWSEDRELEEPLGAAELGLIYVNPEGPEGNPDILAAAHDIRVTFGRMGMNDEETAALIVGGHTLGKAHGASPKSCVGPEPAAEGVEAQGFGWKNSCGTGAGPDATTSGLEGAWTVTPITWSNNYVQNLYNFEWKQTKSPAGAIQWVPEDDDLKVVPDAFDPNKFHAPVMQTTDLALRYDPAYGEVTKKFLEDADYMNKTFARAWFKLTHRDMGPKARYVGAEVPTEDLVWQDPLPAADYEQVTSEDIDALKADIRNSGLPSAALVRAAWGAAATFRDTDYRGGANGGRIALAPQSNWIANSPEELAGVLEALTTIRDTFNTANAERQVSLADLIVLGGVVAIEDAVTAAGYNKPVPFSVGRVDAAQEMTSVEGFEYLRPAADGFRNFYSDRARLSPADMLIDRADMLTLTVPEMTVLVAGLRVLDANTNGTAHGVFTDTPGVLTNDFFTNLLDMSTEWKPVDGEDYVFTGFDRTTGEEKWTATEVDLVFGSNAELRAVAEVYAFDGGEETFIEDFIAAWTKVMMLDRFDLN